jgi:hypothetical protein
MLRLLFFKKKKNGEKSIVCRHISTLKYNNSSLLKGFKRYLTSGSCELSLEVEHLDDLWFGITQLETNIKS